MPGHHSEALVPDDTDVDPATPALDGDLDPGGGVAAESEVRGEQVAGAGGQDGHRHPGAGECGDAGHHGPVAAADEDDLGAVVDRLGGLALAGVLGGGLQPHRLRPAGHRESAGDGAAEQVHVGHLDGIHHDGRPGSADDVVHSLIHGRQCAAAG
jgi:hypothetical protein